MLHYSQRSRDRRPICGVLQRSISDAIAERTAAGPQWTTTRSYISPADWTTVSHAFCSSNLSQELIYQLLYSLINNRTSTGARPIPPSSTPGTCSKGWLVGLNYCFLVRATALQSSSTASLECLAEGGAILGVISNSRDNNVIEQEVIRQREMSGSRTESVRLGFLVNGKKRDLFIFPKWYCEQNAIKV